MTWRDHLDDEEETQATVNAAQVLADKAMELSGNQPNLAMARLRCALDMMLLDVKRGDAGAN